jgi:chromosome segregation ATPase
MKLEKSEVLALRVCLIRGEPIPPEMLEDLFDDYLDELDELGDDDVDGLRKEISRLEERCDDIDREREQAEAERNGMENERDELQTKLDEMEAERDELRKNYHDAESERIEAERWAEELDVKLHKLDHDKHPMIALVRDLLTDLRATKEQSNALVYEVWRGISPSSP